MNAFLVNLLVMIVWGGLVGSTAPAVLATGFLVGYLLLGWLRPIAGAREYVRKAPRAVGLALFFVWELVLSTLRVAWDVLTPTAYRRPGVVAVPLTAETDVEITLLATLITLTPGSLSLDVSPQRDRLYVHVMFLDDPDVVRQEIEEGFERRVLELLR